MKSGQGLKTKKKKQKSEKEELIQDWEVVVGVVSFNFIFVRNKRDNKRKVGYWEGGMKGK